MAIDVWYEIVDVIVEHKLSGDNNGLLLAADHLNQLAGLLLAVV